MSKELACGCRAQPRGLFVTMNLAETRLSLEGYRIQVLEKLKALGDPQRARDLIAEVDVVLRATDLRRPAQRAFWEALYTDIDVLTEEVTTVLRKDLAAELAGIIDAAKTEIRRYLSLAST